MPSPREILAKLERDYALALGEYETAEHATETIVGLAALEAADRRIQARKRILREKMDRLTYLIRLQVDPEWDPLTVRGIVPRTIRRKGVVAKAAYRVLKAANMPLKAREIANLVAPHLGLMNPGHREITKLESSIRGTLERRRAEGMVEHDGGKPTRWSIKQGRWQPPSAPAGLVQRP